MKKSRLISGENILFEANRSNWIFLKESILLALLFSYGVYLYIYFLFSFKMIIMVFLPLIILYIFCFLYDLLTDYGKIFILTNKRLIIKSDEILIKRIKTFHIEKNMFGKIFNYGTIVIEEKKVFYFKGISKPDILLEILEDEKKKGVIKI